jgi:hypothetical protein
MGSETAQDFLGETEVEPHRKLVSCRNAHDTHSFSGCCDKAPKIGDIHNRNVLSYNSEVLE